MNPPTKVGPYPRPGTWRAPTWSWASTKAAVEYCWNTDDGGDFLAPHISVIDFQIGQVCQNPLGQLRAAKLIVSGQLATAKIRHYHEENMTHGTMSSPIAIEVSGELKKQLHVSSTMTYGRNPISMWQMANLCTVWRSVRGILMGLQVEMWIIWFWEDVSGLRLRILNGSAFYGGGNIGLITLRNLRRER